MAIYHMSVKPVSRSAGRSATAAAAYRAGSKIIDQRTGEIHDFTRKQGVLSASLVLPDTAGDWAKDRSTLWNAAEQAERRKDACVAREIVVALPSELNEVSRQELVLEFAKGMADSEGCAVDVCIHEPSTKGDDRNYHAHLLRTTRVVGADGLESKLDTEKAGRSRKQDLEVLRERWATLTNDKLKSAGLSERVDHRTLEAQGIERQPTKHIGYAAMEFERRTGSKSDVRLRCEKELTSKDPKLQNEIDRTDGDISRLEHLITHYRRFSEEIKADEAKKKAQEKPVDKTIGLDKEASLVLELNRVSSRLDMVKKKYRELDRQVDEISADLNKLSTRCDELQVEHDSLSRIHFLKRDKLFDQRNELAIEHNRKVPIEKALKHQRDEVGAQGNELIKEQRRLQNELSALRKQNEELRNPKTPEQKQDEEINKLLDRYKIDYTKDDLEFDREALFKRLKAAKPDQSLKIIKADIARQQDELEL